MNINAVGGIDLFPVPILKYHREDHTIIQPMIVNLLNQLKLEPNHQGVQRYFISQDIIDNNNEFKNFISWLEACANNYADNVLGVTGNNFINTNMWLNVNSGATETTHHHVNSIISATYYVQLDPEQHVGLNFHRPGLVLHPTAPMLKYEVDKVTPYNVNLQTLKTDQGDLLMWPSEINHGYTQPEVNFPRISLSMNFMPSVITLSKNYGFKVERLN